MFAISEEGELHKKEEGKWVSAKSDSNTCIFWPDSSRYDFPRLAAEECVSRGLALSWRRSGNSGVVERNSVVLEIASTIHQVPLLKRDEQEWWVMHETGETAGLQIADPQLIVACQAVYQEFRCAASLEEWKSFFSDGYDAREVGEFNKCVASKLPPPEGYDVGSKRDTVSTSNVTAVVVRVGPVIHCPNDRIARILIGQGGENIKALAMRHRMNIKVVVGK